MKAAQLVGPKRFELIDVATPAPVDGECLIKLEQLSICGSDMREAYGPVLPEEEYPLALGRPCHECAGVVVESRNNEFREGQRVLVLPTVETGGLLEYINSRSSRMVALPNHGDLADWVMCQPSGTVLYACQKMGSVMGKSVLILGQGAIGLSFTMITSKLGARQVIAVDPLSYRLEYAKEFGATHIIEPGKQQVMEAVREITQGVGPDITVEAAGYPGTLDLSVRLVRQFGMVIVFGIQADDIVPVDADLWMTRQPTIIPTTGARTPDPTSHIEEAVRLRERGWFEPARMVTHRLGFNAPDVNHAYRMYEQHLDNVIKVVISL